MPRCRIIIGAIPRLFSTTVGPPCLPPAKTSKNNLNFTALSKNVSCFSFSITTLVVKGREGERVHTLLYDVKFCQGGNWAILIK